ncbi:histone deacetylase HDT1 [Beta vulgaris subsp. vulgaris]|uniref:histone deacetylase HDT1 n=1 Tax=Beta vulgaris subsp. vulgaris TaxID=3555 RepID=UPI002036B816|nr:histone deacetylase HDT1 [Beta vulgaris subsp. vulgaris]
MMKFWGVEVKNGGPLKVQPGDGKLVHLSQACLGEVKKDKGNDYIRLYAQKNGQKFVIGMLSHERLHNLNLDLIFEDEFELSHDLKQGSVHFAGYNVDNSSSVADEEDSEDDLEEPVPVDALTNGKPEATDLKASGSKADAGGISEKAEGKSKVKIVEPSKDDDDEDDEDEDEDDDDDDSAEDEDMASSDDGTDEEDDSDEDSLEETPKKPETSKKRPGESTSKTPVPEKKAKFSTPQQKADGKKVSGHVATPYPVKQTGKGPASSDKPTSSKSFTCSSCNKSFGSDQAVQAHSKAKHSGK